MSKLRPNRKFCLALLIVCVLLLGVYRVFFADVSGIRILSMKKI